MSQNNIAKSIRDAIDNSRRFARNPFFRIYLKQSDARRGHQVHLDENIEEKSINDLVLRVVTIRDGSRQIIKRFEFPRIYLKIYGSPEKAFAAFSDYFAKNGAQGIKQSKGKYYLSKGES